MKSFLAILRIIIVGCLWGIVFTEGIRVIMLCNWHFDIFGAEHWRQFRQLWRAGWTPHDSKEWALILLIVTFFPMILTGWWTLSLVAWEDIIWKIICFPYNLYQRYFAKSDTTAITVNNRYGIVKRKSYKQIRPAGISSLRVPISDYGTTAISAPMASPTASALAGSSFASSSYSATPAAAPVKKKTDVAATIDHALFKFDDDDDDDFDLDIDSFEKADMSKKKQTTAKSANYDDDDDDEWQEKPKKSSKKKVEIEDEAEDENSDADKTGKESKSTRRKTKATEDKDNKEKDKRRTRTADSEEKSTRTKKKTESSEEEQVTSHGPVYDTLTQKGYDILTNVAVGNTVIDFVGVSETDICFCLIDKEAGDWLADEEMFNGEEPLWFSENSHRVSPVCKLNTAKKLIEEKLEDEGFEQHLSFYVVVQMANIINADDMFEIWNDMDINVTRINRGAPKEIKLFSKQLTEADDKMSKKNLEKLRNILKSVK